MQKLDVALSHLTTGPGVRGYAADPDDKLRVELHLPNFPALRMYSTVDRSILSEVLDTFTSTGSIHALQNAYPRRAFQHGILEKCGRWMWSTRHCVAVKWKVYFFKDWYSQEVVQAISLIGLPVTSVGEREFVLHTVHGELRFRALDASVRDRWVRSLQLAGTLSVGEESGGTLDLTLEAGNILEFADGQAPLEPAVEDESVVPVQQAGAFNFGCAHATVCIYRMPLRCMLFQVGNKTRQRGRKMKVSAAAKAEAEEEEVVLLDVMVDATPDAFEQVQEFEQSNSLPVQPSHPTPALTICTLHRVQNAWALVSPMEHCI